MIKALKPGWTPALVRDMIVKTALDRGAPGFDQYYGWGRITLDPTALEDDGLSSEHIKQKYEQAQAASVRDKQGFQEDLSEFIAAESRKRQRRDEENQKKKKDKYRF